MDFAALARRYHETGFLIVDEVFTAQKTAEIERELKRYIADLKPEEIPGNVVYEAGDEQKIRNIFRLAADPYFDSLARDSQVTELGRAIFDDEPILFGVELFGKPARVGSEVPYHQDNAYFNLLPDDAFTCWVALADSNEENGCVRYIEGSHKLGNLPHRPSGVKGNSMGLAEMPKSAGDEVCGIVPRGGAIIHHCNTIHRSEPNRSDRDRPGLLFVYKAARCRIDGARAANYSAVSAAVNG